MASAGCDVLAVLRAPFEGYPPSLNQIQLLAERGFRTIAIDVARADEGAAPWSHPNLQRLRIGQPDTASASLPRRVADYLQFGQAVRRIIRRERPGVVIAYDPNAMIAAGRLWARRLPTFNVWHFHELADAAPHSGLTRRAISFANKNAVRADLVIFPDSGRAEAFRQAVGQPIAARTVYNCPRRLENLPANKLRPRLRERGVPETARIVLFQGGIGITRGIDAAIRSMKFWPANAWLVLIGPTRDQYRRELDAIAAGVGVQDRVIFLEPVPYAELFGYTAGADIGLSVVSNQFVADPNWIYTAGAINKRFEYMATGLPQIANRGPGMSELIEDSDAGVLVTPSDFGELGHAVAGLLGDDEGLRRMSRSARTAHLELYCYEVQFAPVLEIFSRVLRVGG